MRAALRGLIKQECDIVGEIDNGYDVLPAAQELRPDVILLDISLPGTSGLVLLPMLRSSLPGATILILTNHAERAYVDEAFARGADGYILKADVPDKLLLTIRNARHHSSSSLNAQSPGAKRTG